MSATSDAAAPPERPKRGRPKTIFTPIYPELPQPTGEQVWELRLRMGWTLEFTATVIGLTDAQAVSDIERSADPRGTPRKLSPWRWMLMLLATGEHPTLMLVPRGTSAGTPSS